MDSTISTGSIKKTSKQAAILFAVLVTAFVVVWALRPTLRPKVNASTRASDALTMKEACLIYDKAPHTESTEIAWALEACWSSRLKFEHHLFERDAADQALGQERNAPLSKLVSYSSLFVANIHRHIWVSDSEIEVLMASCRHVFFVTSTRPIADRVVSAARVLALSGAPHNDDNDDDDDDDNDDDNSGGSSSVRNATLSPAMLRWALMEVRSRRSEARATALTKRPFSGERRLPVDYVIRADSWQVDTSALLHAFGCPAYLSTTNYHMDDPSITTDDDARRRRRVDLNDAGMHDVDDVVTEESLLAEAKRLFTNDSRHELYQSYALRSNHKGLLRAAELAKLRMESLDPDLLY